jgi:hypothetical protein
MCLSLGESRRCAQAWCDARVECKVRHRRRENIREDVRVSAPITLEPGPDTSSSPSSSASDRASHNTTSGSHVQALLAPLKTNTQAGYVYARGPSLPIAQGGENRKEYRPDRAPHSSTREPQMLHTSSHPRGCIMRRREELPSKRAKPGASRARDGPTVRALARLRREGRPRGTPPGASSAARGLLGEVLYRWMV